MPESHLKFHSAHGKRRILIIEDELINREILGYMLSDIYEVLFAETGKQALEILEAQYNTLSMVLLDLNLPYMKGADILKTMRDDARTAAIPVIVMTADQNAEVECLELGATDFITKPYPKQEIVLARIRRTIELYEDRDILHWTEKDRLTGLYNPEFFFHYAAQLDAFHPETSMDAILLDITHFHMLNERYGRERCNGVLKQIAEILLEKIQDSGWIAGRRGGDTFLLYGPHREDYQRILDWACVEMTPGTRIHFRMGIYADNSRKIDVESRFDRAKRAADSVKNNLVNPIAVYNDSMYEKEMLSEQLQEDFHTAIAEKQFTVHYQPKFDIRGENPVLNSVEALVRWKHPKLGMISPGIFIPLFEENGLIRELDSYVWRESARQIREWKEKLHRVIPVSVNVSRIDLNDPSLLKMLEQITEKEGLDCSNFLLEITESAYTENSEQITDVVKTLRESGFIIEMDDFGTGYSSLNMITTLPIDMLKIDMQFIRSAFREKQDTRLINAVIGLAHSLGFPTIAEGVETIDQYQALKDMGCDFVQGYYFSKPLPSDEFEAYFLKLEKAN